MTTYVLVHGAWHGGWCWRRVTTLLRAQGHEVHAPSLTGLGERSHLVTRQTGLDTHITDVVRLLEVEGLEDVVLVGHSYAGQVLAGVATERPALLRRVIHLDAFVPEDGEAAIDLLPEQVAHHYRESVAGPGDGWLIPPRSLEVLGVTDAADLAWLTPRLVPHPWLTYTQPARVTADVPGAFVHCTDWLDVFAPQAERAAARGWPVRDLATGHEAMVTAPQALADALVELSQEA